MKRLFYANGHLFDNIRKILIRKLCQLIYRSKFTLPWSYLTFLKCEMSIVVGILLKNLCLKNIPCALW